MESPKKWTSGTFGNSRTLWMLTFLAFLFFARVLAQLVEYFADLPLIPPFEKWHSATLPYWVLLTVQMLILGWMFRVGILLRGNQLKVSKGAGNFLYTAGFLYLFSMIVRHILGLTVLSHTVWFTSFISIYFHYVLALYLIVLGKWHLRRAV